MSESAQIAAVLIGLAVLTPVLVSLRHVGVPRYPADSYAGFRDGPEPLSLDCEGLCRGATAHEPDDDGLATCITCGTTRTGPTWPDEA